MPDKIGYIINPSCSSLYALLADEFNIVSHKLSVILVSSYVFSLIFVAKL